MPVPRKEMNKAVLHYLDLAASVALNHSLLNRDGHKTLFASLCIDAKPKKEKLSVHCSLALVFVFERFVCSGLQFLLQTLWWRAALLFVWKPTRLTTSPAEPPEPNLLRRSPGTEMERSWRLQFIPRYWKNISESSIIIQSLTPTWDHQMYQWAAIRAKPFKTEMVFLPGWGSSSSALLFLPVSSLVPFFFFH